MTSWLYDNLNTTVRSKVSKDIISALCTLMWTLYFQLDIYLINLFKNRKEQIKIFGILTDYHIWENIRRGMFWVENSYSL